MISTVHREKSGGLHGMDNSSEFLVDVLDDIAPQLAKEIPSTDVAGFNKDKKVSSTTSTFD
jgi:hypothetical protein